ncbi:MAG: hypothetical protein AUG09_06055 [Acidobacteria bacterium 13_1_20CM_2_68_7]|nr:MAG: hypothetical protein AUG09_06055 [Acidobacteria bacterium 13_1_20CM_2_68_7]
MPRAAAGLFVSAGFAWVALVSGVFFGSGVFFRSGFLATCCGILIAFSSFFVRAARRQERPGRRRIRG